MNRQVPKSPMGKEKMENHGIESYKSCRNTSEFQLNYFTYFRSFITPLSHPTDHAISTLHRNNTVLNSILRTYLLLKYSSSSSHIQGQVIQVAFFFQLFANRRHIGRGMISVVTPIRERVVSCGNMWCEVVMRLTSCNV